MIIKYEIEVEAINPLLESGTDSNEKNKNGEPLCILPLDMVI